MSCICRKTRENGKKGTIQGLNSGPLAKELKTEISYVLENIFNLKIVIQLLDIFLHHPSKMFVLLLDKQGLN